MSYTSYKAENRSVSDDIYFFILLHIFFISKEMERMFNHEKIVHVFISAQYCIAICITMYE